MSEQFLTSENNVHGHVMRIAALSDIHANHVALEACLDYIYAHDFYGIAFLGDYLTDCACPEKTLEILKNIPAKYKTWFVRGNREDYLISHHDNPESDWHYCSASGSLLYTYERISNDDIEFLRNMPICMKVAIDGVTPFKICHGSLFHNKVVLEPNGFHIKAAIKHMNCSLLLCGHSHQNFIYCLNNKLVVNGGAVGVPCNHQVNAQFSVIEYYNDLWHPEIISVPYDIEKAIAEIDESGLTDKGFWWTKAMKMQLRTGINLTNDIAMTAAKISNECGLPYSDENVWNKAAVEIGLT